MKNLLKVISGVAFVLMLSFVFNFDGKASSRVLDLAALNTANAWGPCVDWAPESVGQPDWFDVSHNFPLSEKQRIDAQYPQYGIISQNRRMCMLGGWEICENYDIAVQQEEVRDHVFYELSFDPPW